MKKGVKLILFSLVMIIALQMPVRSQAAGISESQKTAGTTKKGLKSENGRYYYYKNGKKVKKRWVTVKKKKYYLNKEGAAAVGVCKIGKGTYLFNEKGQLQSSKKLKSVSLADKNYCVNKEGRIQTGWQVIGEKLYYFDKKTGEMTVSKKIDGITLTAKGHAKTKDKSTKLKVLTINIISKITNDKMSKAQKLRACYNYVVKANGYVTWRSFNNYKGWEADYAYEFLKTKRGNCYNFAAAFGYLAKEAGYKVYVIRGRVPGSRDGAADGYTRHSWVMINKLHYDPEAEYKGWGKGIYGARNGAGYIVDKNKI